MAITLSTLLTNLPASLRDELIGSFRKIEQNFREGRWEPSELNGGKLCEVVYSILSGHVTGSFPQKAVKPRNMLDKCKDLEKAGSTFPRSIRIQIPRMLISLYEIRNNRNVGHVGGDVDPNYMDAMCVLHMSKWILAELIRVFHNVSPDEATAAVEALSSREISLVWNINGVSRILNTSFSMMDKTLLLLYSSPAGMPEKELVKSLEHSNPTVYRRDILKKAHKRRWIEYSATDGTATVSPLGSQIVETKIASLTEPEYKK